MIAVLIKNLIVSNWVQLFPQQWWFYQILFV